MYEKLEAVIVLAWLSWPFVWMAVDFFRDEAANAKINPKERKNR